MNIVLGTIRRAVDRHWVRAQDSYAVRPTPRIDCALLEDRVMLSASPLLDLLAVDGAMLADDPTGAAADPMAASTVTVVGFPENVARLDSSDAAVDTVADPPTPRRELVIIDSAVQNTSQLIDDLQGNETDDRQIEFMVLDGGLDVNVHQHRWIPEVDVRPDLG